MRMDQRNALSAYEVVNDYSEENLSRILHEYGEERFARKIAHNICVSRQQAPIRTTGELIEIIKRSIPAKIRATGGHPAKRTFQAIRIEVNQELTVLSESLDGMIDLLNDGGRLCVITFHSLEDRIVKNIFRKNEHPCTCPPEFPVCVCGKKSKGTVVTRKPILPGEEEMETNPRSKSAKLRVFERKCDGSARRRQRSYGQTADGRVNSTDRTKRYTPDTFEDGSAVRRLAAQPQEAPKEARPLKSGVSSQTRRNRHGRHRSARATLFFLPLSAHCVSRRVLRMSSCRPWLPRRRKTLPAKKKN